MRLKLLIRKFLPDSIIRLYRDMKLFPKYFGTIIKDFGKKYPTLSFFSDQETVDMILNDNKSLSRFGDGEIKWMLHCKLNSFQDYSDELAEELKRVYQSNNSNLLIAIPYGIVNSKKCSLGAKFHWRVVRDDFFSAINEFGGIDRCFSNASITRPYIDYNDYEYSSWCFNNLKRIWDNKDIIIVEGNKTKLGMGNDLFSKAKSIRRIICPATNAFEKINDIKQSIRVNANFSDRILVALGPTATILAADMCDEGYQIIDIGHIDVEYMWFLKKEVLRTPIDGKYVNESGERYQSDLYENDPLYLNSIIDRIY